MNAPLAIVRVALLLLIFTPGPLGAAALLSESPTTVAPVGDLGAVADKDPAVRVVTVLILRALDIKPDPVQPARRIDAAPGGVKQPHGDLEFHDGADE